MTAAAPASWRTVGGHRPPRTAILCIIEVMSAHANYFSPDYSTARSRFRQMVEAAGGRLDVLPLEARGPAGENLGMDTGSFGAEIRAACFSTHLVFTAWKGLRDPRSSFNSWTVFHGRTRKRPSSSFMCSIRMAWPGCAE